MSAPPLSRATTAPTAALPAASWTMKMGGYLRSPWGCTLLTGLLLWCSFYPLNWGWLGWVALVPLLFLCDTTRTTVRGWRLYLPIYLASLLFTLVMLQWIRLASTPMYAIWIIVSLYVSWWYPTAVWLIRRLTGTLRLPLLLVAPVVWTGLEFLRALIYIGFAWYYLGHTQHEVLPLIQIADLFGAYGVSFVVMTGNVAVWETLCWLGQRYYRQDKTASPRRFARAAAWAGVLLGASLAYGYWQLSRASMLPGPRVAIVQGNMPQDLRNQPDEALENDRHFTKLGDQAARLRPDLLILPETCFSGWWHGIGPGVDRARLDAYWQGRVTGSEKWIKTYTDAWQCPILIGFSSRYWETTGEVKCNSALLFDVQGRQQGRYDKIYLLPWGEYIPLEDYLPFLKWLSPYDYAFNLRCGTQVNVFPWQETPFAVLICYEDSVPHLAPQFMRQPMRPTFFVNLSNDGWFKGSEEHEQHFVSTRFRAIENRRAVARSVNMGISGVIDGNGQVIALPGGVQNWSEAKACAAVIEARIPLDQRDSLYVQWGEVLPTLCWFLILPGMVLALRRAATEERRGTAPAAHPV